MRKFVLCLFLTFASLTLFAQGIATVPVPAPPGGYMSPDVNMPTNKIYVDKSTILVKHRGKDHVVLTVTCGPLTAYTGGLTDRVSMTKQRAIQCANGVNGDGSVNDSIVYPYDDVSGLGGAFRVLCGTSHQSFDDPIVKPFQSGMTHLHTFFGNTTTDASRDPSKMDEYGNSTCDGGTVNRTGYWVPTLVYHCPAIDIGCDHARNGEVQIPVINNAYYKVEGENQADDDNQKYRATWWPKGFRMITGDASNIDPNRTRGRFDCYDPEGAAHNTTGVYPYGTFDHLPSSKEIYTAHALGPQDGTLTTPNGPTTVGDPGEPGYVANPNGVGPPLNSVVGYLPAPCMQINLLIAFPHCSATDTSVLYLPTPVGGTFSGHVDTTKNCADPAFTNFHPDITYNVHTNIKNPADWDYIVLSSDLPMHPGALQAGSTTSSLVLAASENSVDNSFRYGYIVIAGTRHQITGYNGTTKVATLDTPLASAPAAGTTYAARTAGGLSRHADWANGWSQDNILGSGKPITQWLIDNCYINKRNVGQMSENRSGSGQTPGTIPAAGQHTDCHDDNIGADGTGVEPAVGTRYYQMQ